MAGLRRTETPPLASARALIVQQRAGYNLWLTATGAVLGERSARRRLDCIFSGTFSAKSPGPLRPQHLVLGDQRAVHVGQ
jgi:hypothetical protein